MRVKVPGLFSDRQDRIGRLIMALAALLMAAGVAVSAAAAHAGAARELSAASLLMTTNAPMLGFAGLAIALGRLSAGFGGLGAAAALLGTLLFSADMGRRAEAAASLFPYAAPIGGSLVIAGWVIVGVCLAIGLLKR